MASYTSGMGLLKRLYYDLARFLEANGHMSPKYRSDLLNEELLCCCERARLAIKDFTHQGDDEVPDCFPVFGDALCDLQWCLHTLANSVHGEDQYRRFLRPIVLDIESALRRPLVWEIRLQKNRQPPSLYCWDDRNGSGGAHLPPGLNVDDLGEIQYLHRLGEGSQGMVYKAWWCMKQSADGRSDLGISDYAEPKGEMGELVAVKEVSFGTQSEVFESMGGYSVSTSNLDCELDVLKRFRHPNIVELKGYTRKVRGEGKYGLVMELMNCSLKDLIESQKLSDLDQVDTLLQVARGMQFLHMAGLMHRDLKPANILIGELNYCPPNARCLSYVVAKLADFGLSKGAAEGVSFHTSKKGTSFYMAPEVRKHYDNACWESFAFYALSADVFSFGTVCFNVLTGVEVPFAREGHPLNSQKFYSMIKRGRVFNIKCGRSNMALLVRQCWCFDPKKRPTFLQICQILEDEKRQILCAATLMSPSMCVKGKKVQGDSSGARNGHGKANFCVQIEQHELKYLDGLEGEHEICKLGKKLHRAIWKGVQGVVVKEVFLEELSSRYSVLKMLNHPNVMKLKGYTSVRAADKYGLVTEKMWCSLQDFTESDQHLLSINLLLQVARGMEFLHSKSILHLRLKPSNILIGPPDCNVTCLGYTAKVTDFWYRTVDWAILYGDECGDSFYIAPELYESWDYLYMDTKLYEPCMYEAMKSADVFSFGTMCFNVLTRRKTPCIGLSEASLTHSDFNQIIKSGEPETMLQKCEGSQMRDLVRACWSPVPHSRPPFVKICQVLETEIYG